MSLNAQIESIINADIQQRCSLLREKGVSADIIAYVYPEAAGESPASPVERPLPKRRMLGSNKGATQKEASASKVRISDETNAPPANYPVRDKFPQDFSDGKVVLVRNYTPKTDALFGDFKNIHSKFKDEHLKVNNIYSPNSRLVFGFGWIVKVKDKTKDLVRALREHGIKYRDVEFEDYLAEVKAGESKTVEKPKVSSKAPAEDTESEDEVESPVPPPKKSKASTKAPVEDVESEDEVESPAPPPKKTTKSKKTKTVVEEVESEEEAPPSKKTTKSKKTKTVVKEVESEEEEAPPPKAKGPKSPSKKKIAKNAWGNFEDDNSFVFVNLPVGNKGRKIPIVVGYQDPEPEEGKKGLDAVFPLDDALQEECKSYGLKFLTKDMIDTVRETDEDMADKLDALWEREDEDELDEDDEDLDEDEDVDEDEDDDEE